MKPRRTGQNHILGDVLLELAMVTREQLDEALRLQMEGDTRPLGVILVALGHLTAREADRALMVQKARRGRFKHSDGIRLLEQAVHRTKQAASSIEELTVAAEELALKAKG